MPIVDKYPGYLCDSRLTGAVDEATPLERGLHPMMARCPEDFNSIRGIENPEYCTVQNWLSIRTSARMRFLFNHHRKRQPHTLPKPLKRLRPCIDLDYPIQPYITRSDSERSLPVCFLPSHVLEQGDNCALHHCSL